MEFDYDLCTKCGLCTKVCGSKALDIDENKRPYEKSPMICNDCGHCMAVCPVMAVNNTRMDPAQFLDMTDPEIPFDQLYYLIRNRRSIRIFKKDPLQPDHINKLLEAVRYIPTGSNRQELKYLVITDPNILQRIKLEMAKKFRLVNNLAKSFPIKLFVKKEDRASLGRLIELWDAGDDPYLRNAPCFLIIYSNVSYFGIPAWDAGIATYNIDLAAQTLGIGTMMNGFYVVTANLFNAVKKASLIPKGYKVLASMCLGYPVIKYKKTVSRMPLDTKIV
jgi:nitroreductase/NAD-dependent dihydropyrimidine dehydrogenase PreA subunit